MPSSSVLSVYVVSGWTTTLICAVSCGLIGPVDWRRPALFLRPGLDCSSLTSSVATCEAALWLETRITIGPAPSCDGDIEIACSLIAAVTLIGLGGRSLFS